MIEGDEGTVRNDVHRLLAAIIRTGAPTSRTPRLVVPAQRAPDYALPGGRLVPGTHTFLCFFARPSTRAMTEAWPLPFAR